MKTQGGFMAAAALRHMLVGAIVFVATALAGPSFQPIGTSGTVGDGNLHVAIGQSGGWGFQIHNDSTTDWLAANLSDFCPSGVMTPPCDSTTWFLSGGVDTFGSYTDLYGPNFVVIGPGQTATEQFVAGVSGVGSIALTRAGIAFGDSQSGNIIFVYDLFDGDPNNGGNQIIGTGDQFALAAATVTATDVPEPSFAWLIGTSLAAVIIRGRRLLQ